MTVCLKKAMLLGLFFGGALGIAQASEFEHRVNLIASYKQECSACHTAYLPSMLPAGSWRRIMSGLDRHFGVDASLDPKTVTELTQWLSTHAGTSSRVVQPPAEDRITRSAWFERKHREVSSAVWQRASVRSKAQCAACHLRADQGDYDEDHVRIPR